jgi:flagellar biosynthesis anti-sigma factor FlgM
MKVPSQVIDAHARTALSSKKPARPVGPPATQISSSNEAAQATVSDETRALTANAGAGTEEQRVAALKKRISDGEYRVNPQVLAMRLLDSIG